MKTIVSRATVLAMESVQNERLLLKGTTDRSSPLRAVFERRFF
jgi:hypothetical protein